MNSPPSLKKGDTVAIMCMAGKTNVHTITKAVKILENWGLKVIIGSTVGKADGSLGGTDLERKTELQNLMNEPTVKAIFSARGGYGSTRIIDEIDFAGFIKNPKWILGFSDITAVIAQVNALNIEAIHGPMPKLFAEKGAKTALKSLKSCLFGTSIKYKYKSHKANVLGASAGLLAGGNLCMLAHCIGSKSDIDTAHKILFIEDVGEYFYSIDRYLVQLKRANKLQKLAGLIVGQFTDMTEGDNPFGKTLEQIILQHCGQYGYPIAFNFSAGHIGKNLPLIMGRKAQFEVTNKEVTLEF